jgi:Skp family chaperone for outer membrane proteins
MSKKSVWIVAFGLILGNLVLALFVLTTRKQSAFIDYNTVYNNCRLKTDLEKDLKRLTETRKSQLDSMQLELSFMSESIKSGEGSGAKLAEFEESKERFLTFQEQYEQENMRTKETYFNQIRAEINEKAKRYAAMRGYDYFFSAMGDGALMYASESEDVTKDFQLFLDKN